VLVDTNARAALAQDAGERGLAHLDRLPAHVSTVQLQQVQGVEEGGRLIPVLAQNLDDGQAPLIANIPRRSPHLEVVYGPQRLEGSEPTSRYRAGSAAGCDRVTASHLTLGVEFSLFMGAEIPGPAPNCGYLLRQSGGRRRNNPACMEAPKLLIYVVRRPYARFAVRVAVGETE
jgi:hypothetical protein